VDHGCRHTDLHFAGIAVLWWLALVPSSVLTKATTASAANVPNVTRDEAQSQSGQSGEQPKIASEWNGTVGLWGFVWVHSAIGAEPGFCYFSGSLRVILWR
jgi:hypothetical protein